VLSLVDQLPRRATFSEPGLRKSVDTYLHDSGAVQLSIELEACLREFAAAWPADWHENGVRYAPLSSLSWQVRGQGEKPLATASVVGKSQSDAARAIGTANFSSWIVPARETQLLSERAREFLLGYLNPRMEAVRVGLAGSRRRGLSVVLRQ